MKKSVKATLFQAIIEQEWLEIRYKNSQGQTTDFYIGINDIDFKNDKLYCEIFNCFKDKDCLVKPKPMKISGIIDATVLEQTFYPTPEELKDKLDNDAELLDFLEINNLDNDILSYLSDCYRMDNDPYLKDETLLEGIDTEVLLKKKEYTLDAKQFDDLLNKLFKVNIFEAEKIYRSGRDLGINLFSIDMNNKTYVVAYRSLSLNFKNKTLKIGDKLKINKSFLVEEEKKATLSTYLDMSPDEFCLGFMENHREYIESIKQNFRHGEKVDTSPRIFLLERRVNNGVDRTFDAINQMQQENKLTFPLKAFFGRNRNGAGSNKETNIVVFDKNKINIDQMRVVYNSMINHITYIKGPPGTGKTETIFNVLLSAYYNNMKVLVCSNNNHPVNDIYSKMTESLRNSGANKDKKLIFPILRLGNRDEMANSLMVLTEAYNFALENKKSGAYDSVTEKTKQKSLTGFQKLKQLLMQYEERIELKERVDKLVGFTKVGEHSPFIEGVYKQIEVQNAKINELPYIKDEDVAKYSVSANTDVDFQNYIYYSALARIKKLLSPINKDLVEILHIEDQDTAVSEFARYLREDGNLKKLTDIFPIIMTTNLSADRLGSPKPHFDLCIMDEAGQCNMASSLIPIIRGENLLLVGDTNQLQPVTVIESDVNEKLIEKYNIKEEYNYVHNSILSTMLSKDKNSKSILLRYHYRCGKKIAGFVNSRFYREQLKLINQNPGHLIYLNVKNTRLPEARNAYKEEAKEIVKIIKENKYKDIGIVTPFVNQAILINYYLKKECIELDDVSAGTIHTLQGSERSVIIMSSALCPKTGKKTMDWIKNNHELINVAVTRAKDTFIFAGDKAAIDALSGKEINDLKALSDYVYSEGKEIVPPSETSISTDFSNNSESEKQFFETITPYFTRRGSKMKIERNVPVKTAIKPINDEDLLMMGKKEFDVVVQASGTGIFSRNTYRTIVVFEIDGGEHVGSKITAARDRLKEEICAKYGVKMIRIANDDVKDYELIIKLFESIIKGIPDIDNVGEQLSLFEE